MDIEQGEYLVRNGSNGELICERASCALTLKERTRGLLGRDGLGDGQALLFATPPWFPVMWMHTFGMQFPVDIIFMDSRWRVLKVNPHLKPQRLSSIAMRARYALELPAGTTDRTRTRAGDKINIIHLRLAAMNQVRRVCRLTRVTANGGGAVG